MCCSILCSVLDYLVCSGRGKCNFQTGLCDCYEQFYGSNCDTYKYRDNYIVNNEYRSLYDVFAVGNDHATFTSDVLHISTTRSPSESFYYLRLSDVFADNVFSVRGDNQIEMNAGGLVIGGKCR